MDTSLSFNKHSSHVAERVSARNNILKALAGTSWGQQKETLLMTYKAVGRSIINYAAPVWSTNLRDTNYRNIQYTQNEALRISTGCQKMSSVDHLHPEANMLKVKKHSELLSTQYLARCLEPENVNFSFTTREPPKRMMKETLFTRHRSAVEPLMIAKDAEETYLTRRQRATLSQLCSSHCKLLNSYKKRLKQTDSSSCPDCGMDPQDVPHLFNCTAHLTTLTPESLWDRPLKTIRELSFQDPENLD